LFTLIFFSTGGRWEYGQSDRSQSFLWCTLLQEQAAPSPHPTALWRLGGAWGSHSRYCPSCCS
jgi:hypothetical protein